MPAAIAAHARELPMPTDSRARRAADAVRACPARANSALAVAFKRDVGLTPGRYVSSTNRRVG